MATLGPITEVSQLEYAFDMAGLTHGIAAEEPVMQLTSFCLNPIFAHRAEEMLLEILQRCRSQLLLYMWQPQQTLLEVYKIFRRVLEAVSHVCMYVYLYVRMSESPLEF